MQYRSYQPLLPCANKRLQYKWDKNCYDIHRTKVQSAKATLNTTPPKIYTHILVKKKKHVLEEERQSIIQRDNHMLRDKISNIMQTTGRTDCKNEYANKRLDTHKRQEELLKIMEQNHRILRRLSQCSAHYSVQAWHEQWMKTRYLMDNISRFPRLGGVQTPGVLTQKIMTSKGNGVKRSKGTSPKNFICSEKETVVKSNRERQKKIK